MPDPVSRRGFLGTAGAAAAGVAAGSPAAPAAAQPARGIEPAALAFLTEEEAAFVAAAVDRLYPSDELSPGAVELGVVQFIDLQLAQAFGVGHRIYLDGPFADGTPQQGYQLPYTPRELYRIGIRGVGARVEEEFGAPLHELPPARRDEALRAMEAGLLDTPEMPSAVFFETLLANTIEGVFSDPVHGGNRDAASWRMLGFPGAYAQYADFVDAWGIVFDRPPMGLAEIPHHHHR
jgi:gluconate 2-dehydrogenase gamma chain